MRILLSSLLALSAWFFSAACVAQLSGPDPYEGRVDVADQGSAARDPALREALAQVLTRVSGPSAPGAAPQLLAQPNSLLSRFGYDRTPDGRLQLVAVFDRRAVDGQLRSAGLPVWGYAQAGIETVPLTVRGLQNGSDYARTLASLRAVPGLRALSVRGAAADQLQLQLSLEGGSNRLLSVFGNHRDLALDGSASSGYLQLVLRH